MAAILPWLIPALVGAATSWWRTRQQNQQQGWQDDQSRAAWEQQEKRRRMLGSSVMSLLERRPDLRSRIPQPLLDWIMRPAMPFTGQRPQSSALMGGLLGGATAGAAGWERNINRTSRIPPFADTGAGFGEQDGAFFADAPITGQTAVQGALQQAVPQQSDEFQTVPNLTGAQVGGFLPPEGASQPEDVPGGGNLMLSGLPAAGGWPALLQRYFREGAGP